MIHQVSERIHSLSNRVYAPTGGSRMAVWFFPTFSVTLGLIYMLQSEQRTASPAFDIARELMPMAAWGAVFLTVALIKILALLTHRAFTYAFAMCIAAGFYITWSVFFLASALSDPNVSFVAPLWPIYVAFFHLAMVSTVTGR